MHGPSRPFGQPPRDVAGALMAVIACVAGCTHAELQYVPPDAAPPDLVTMRSYDFAMPGSWNDFPSEPVVDTSTGMPPSDAPTLFAQPGETDGGPCLVEPVAGAVMPLNWIRPRVRFVALAGQNLFEIRELGECFAENGFDTVNGDLHTG